MYADHYAQVNQFLLHCGALPAPESADNPLGYKFSWSPRGGLLALLNRASFLAAGAVTHIPGPELMTGATPSSIPPNFVSAFETFPNRDSVPFQKFYNIPEAETVRRCTLRYTGFPAFMATLMKLGWLSAEVKECLVDGMEWREVMQRACGASGNEERCIVSIRCRLSAPMRTSTLITQIKQVCAFPSESEATRIIDGLRWMGLFSGEKVAVHNGALLDTLCARLEIDGVRSWRARPGAPPAEVRRRVDGRQRGSPVPAL